MWTRTSRRVQYAPFKSWQCPDAHKRQMIDSQVGQLRASRVYTAPSEPGLYAWYYRPSSTDPKSLAAQIANLCIGPANAAFSLKLDYGLRFESRAQSTTRTSDGKSLAEVIEEAFSESLDVLSEMLSNHLAPFFTRPIYIGMASSLRSRLYDGHFKEMLDLWDPDHPVSIFLETTETTSRHPAEIVEMVCRKLSIPHSFALEARIRGFATNELFVHYIVMPNAKTGNTADKGERRAAERLLQLVSLPVCGKI